MARPLITATLFLCIGCASAPKAHKVEANPTLLDQKLLSDVVASAFSRVDGLDLRRHVNGKNVAVQVAAVYPTETSMIRAQTALLLTRAGAVRADLARGGDLVALVVLRAYGLQTVSVSDGHQQRGFLIGDLVLQRPGSGEIYREPLAAKALDHYYSDGSRERRNVGGRPAAKRPQEKRRAEQPPPEPEPEPEPMVEAEPEPEPEEVQPTRRERRRERRARPARERRSNDDARDRDRDRKAKQRRAREAEARARAAKKKKKERRNRRRRRRQPLILE